MSAATKPLTPAEFAAKMREQAARGDTEMAHSDADEIIVQLLRQLGYDEGADIYNNMERWFA